MEKIKITNEKQFRQICENIEWKIRKRYYNPIKIFDETQIVVECRNELYERYEYFNSNVAIENDITDIKFDCFKNYDFTFDSKYPKIECFLDTDKEIKNIKENISYLMNKEFKRNEAIDRKEKTMKICKGIGKIFLRFIGFFVICYLMFYERLLGLSLNGDIMDSEMSFSFTICFALIFVLIYEIFVERKEN